MPLREMKKSEYFPNPEIPVGLWRIRDQQPVTTHAHDFVEIAIIAAGSGEHEFAGTVLPVAVGDVFVIQSDAKHAWRKTQELDVINVLLHDLEAIPELTQLRAHPAFDAIFLHEPNLRSQQKGRGRLHLEMGELNDVMQLTKRLDHAIHRDRAPFPLIARVILLDLVSLLCESYIAAPQEEQQAALRVGRAVRHLETNWTSPADHEKLAAIMHVSVATFYRLFRHATGTTPNHYLNGLRVKEARRRLRDTDQPITAIAYEVGFSDSNYFSTIFRKLKGMSPREYRRTHRSSADPTDAGEARI